MLPSVCKETSQSAFCSRVTKFRRGCTPTLYQIHLFNPRIDTTLYSSIMPAKSNNQKKAEAAAAGKKPKLTKQAENAGKSATQKKAEQQAKKAAKNEKKGITG
uniref:Uncharacterized protein n=1 Tax=Tetraselmis chuii TaxID=63592 RepID=A0A7S1XB38_9CHLO